MQICYRKKVVKNLKDYALQISDQWIIESIFLQMLLVKIIVFIHVYNKVLNRCKKKKKFETVHVHLNRVI